MFISILKSPFCLLICIHFFKESSNNCLKGHKVIILRLETIWSLSQLLYSSPLISGKCSPKQFAYDSCFPVNFIKIISQRVGHNLSILIFSIISFSIFVNAVFISDNGEFRVKSEFILLYFPAYDRHISAYSHV